MFSCEYCEIYCKNFEEHLRKAASGKYIIFNTIISSGQKIDREWGLKFLGKGGTVS